MWNTNLVVWNTNVTLIASLLLHVTTLYDDLPSGPFGEHLDLIFITNLVSK